MDIYDLFAPTGVDEWFNDVEAPRMDVIRQLMAGPLPGDDDLETAVALTRLVHAELEEFGTKNEVQRLDNEPQMAVAQRSLRAVLDRHGLKVSLPWRDFPARKPYPARRCPAHRAVGGGDRRVVARQSGQPSETPIA